MIRQISVVHRTIFAVLCDWSLAIYNTMMESVMERDKYRSLVRLVTCNIQHNDGKCYGENWWMAKKLCESHAEVNGP